VIPAAAPAVPEAAPAAPAPAATGIPGGAPAFDAILMLQSLAATAQTLDGASFEAADTSDLLAMEGEEEDDDTGEDLESSLAFLSALLTATTPKGSPGEFAAGGQGQGAAADEGASPPMPNANPLTAAPDAKPRTVEGENSLDLMAAMTPAPEPVETRGGGDASQNLARAAELLLQTPRAAPAPVEHRIGTHARDPRWAEEFGTRVSLMVRGNESTASLALTPIDLGPVEVNVTVRDSQATIHFGASQAETRALLEASLPRLRELLASQGFNLTDASVSSGFSRQQQSGQSPADRGAGEAETSTTEARPLRQRGLLDLYA
jgi:flagellar hook-length control protein FliK